MRPILIGAGRGRRLGPNTDDIPKTLVPVMGRPMLDWILEALAHAGFAKKDVVFVCGYKGDVLRARHPEFTFVENKGWESNNILASLFCARDFMKGGFLCSYADILYKGEIVSMLTNSANDRVLACDTAWRRRYVDRSQHPESDGEKMRANEGRVIEVARTIPPEDAHGEYIGVAKFTKDGARSLIEAHDEARFPERSYLIPLFQWMIDRGADFRHVDTPGGYMEIDTTEDLACAEKWWRQ
jgi:choline kinase